MMSDIKNDLLYQQMQVLQKQARKNHKARLNPGSPFGLLTDEEIAMVLAMRAKQLRVYQQKKQRDFSREAGLSSASSYANFEQTGTASLRNFIKIMRAFGRLEELSKLLKPTAQEKLNQLNKKPKQRVR